MKIKKTISILTAALMLCPLSANGAEKQTSDFPYFDKNEVNGTVTLKIPSGVSADVKITLDSPEGKAFPYYSGTFDGGNEYSFDFEGRDNTADDYRIYNLSVQLSGCDIGGKADTFIDIINGNDESSFKIIDVNDHPESYAEYLYSFEIDDTKESDVSWAVTKSDKTSKTVTVYINGVTKLLLGDMNDDGVIDATDASAILTAYAYSSVGQGNLTDEQTIIADVNKDGAVDATDASTVLTYYARSSVENVGTFADYLNSLNPQTTTTTVTTTTSKTTTTTSNSATTSKATTTTSNSATTSKATTTTSNSATTSKATTTTNNSATTSKATTTTSTLTTTTTTTTFSPVVKMEDMNVIFAVMAGAPKYADNSNVSDGYIKVTDKNYSSVSDVEKLIKSTCTGELQKALISECQNCFKEIDGVLYVAYLPRSYYQFHTSKGVEISDKTETEFTAITVDYDELNGYGKAVFTLENNEWKISAYDFVDKVATTTTTVQTTVPTATTTFSPVVKMEDMNVIFAVMAGAPKYADNSNVSDGYIKVTDKNYSSVSDVEKLIKSTCTGELQKALISECQNCFKEIDGVLYVAYLPRSYYQFHTSKGVEISDKTETEFTAITVDYDELNGYGKAVFTLENNEWKISAYDFVDKVATTTTTVQTTVPTTTTTVSNPDEANKFNKFSFTVLKANQGGYLEKINGTDVLTIANADGTYTLYQYVNNSLTSKNSTTYEGTSAKMTADELYKACLNKTIENGFSYNSAFKKTSNAIGYVQTESDGLRIRTSPNTDTAENIITVLPSGLFFNILDDTNPEWFYVTTYYNGYELTGYIYKEFTVS